MPSLLSPSNVRGPGGSALRNTIGAPHEDLLVPLVMTRYRYRVLPFLSLPLGHCAMFLYSQTLGVCHLLEFGGYHPQPLRVLRRDAVRHYKLPAPQFSSSGKVQLESLVDTLHTVSGLQGGLDFRGRLIELPAGSAKPAVELGQKWAAKPPRYSPTYTSCMAFVAELQIATGDPSARPNSAWIRSWHISERGRAFHYHPKLRKLVLSEEIEAGEPPR